MNITLVVQYAVDGKYFDTLDMAEAYVARLIYSMLKPQLIAKGFTKPESYKVFDTLINIRHAITPLLACKFE